MPSLTINPPRPPPPPPERNTNSTSPPPPDNTSFTFSASPPGSATFYPTVADTTATSALSNDAGSPTAPEYSPITPKVQPILPAISSSQQYDGPLQQPPPPSPPPSGMNAHYPPPPLPQPQPQQQEHRHDAPSVQHQQQQQQQQQQPQLQPETNISPSTNPAEAAPASAISPTSFIPQPAPLPFSSEDSTDAIALRAAISALQFQKKKAQEDLRTLEHTKQHALKNPSQFKEALVAGKLKEERREFGGVQGILDEDGSGEGASDEEDGVNQTPARDGKDDAMGGATEEVARKGATSGEAPVAAGGRNTSDSGAPAPAQHDQEYNRSQSPTTKNPAAQHEHFPPIPGAQNVVRTPYINWEKYHILSEPLDRLHEQQRRWPGAGGISPSDQRRRRSEREYAVAAPYSPFYDRLDEGTATNMSGNRGSASGGGGVSPTSLGTGTAPAATAGAASGDGAGGASEHPMETRRGSSHRYPPPTTR
ncbi:hypothetical protein KC363_g706 [Hortaea werneckii]|nr:hypothetical protein KC361_g3518 [Hortaea werneckii]KAI7196816.1 hypothetical protein KC363_g706 [Hortaea werneckii]